MGDRTVPLRLAVLASGSGSNLQAIIDANEGGEVPAEIAVVVSNKSSAFALERARRHGIPAIHLDPTAFPSREAYDRRLAQIIDDHHVDLIAMAGYMLLLSPWFIRHFKNRVMNIHPALCPAFPGTNGIEDALAYGVRVTGVTVHFADEGCDTGPVILQYPVLVSDDDDRESLAERIHAVEHRLYPLAIRLYAEGKLVIEGRRVRILDETWTQIVAEGVL